MAAAKRIGGDPSIVSRWVRGDRPPPELADLIADALVVDMDFVLSLLDIRPAELDDDDEDVIKRELLSMLRRIDFSDKMVLNRVKDDLGSWIKRQSKEGRGR